MAHNLLTEIYILCICMPIARSRPYCRLQSKRVGRRYRGGPLWCLRTSNALKISGAFAALSRFALSCVCVLCQSTCEALPIAGRISRPINCRIMAAAQTSVHPNVRLVRRVSLRLDLSHLQLRHTVVFGLERGLPLHVISIR